MKNSILFIALLSFSGVVLAQDAAGPIPPKPPEAELLFLFTAEGKKDVITEGYFSEKDFSHSNPNALVITAETTQDISGIERLKGVEAKCFTGKVEDAKTIVDQLILNVDGNGDSWLDNMNVVTTERKVIAKYSLITEAENPENHEFEIESCEAPKTKIEKDPVFGKFDMCDKSIVKLPDHVYLDLKRISESQNMEAMKLEQVKSLFRGVALNKSMQNYCTVVASVMDETVERCQEAMLDEELFNPQILELTKLGATGDEVTCSLSALIAMLISPF